MIRWKGFSLFGADAYNSVGEQSQALFVHGSGWSHLEPGLEKSGRRHGQLLQKTV
ncbi:hypothetical protein DSCO28_28780 [Desulfosarcina ovata subsp. sediminis]|uniref:Uncharacterized protein n=1 Tax=Desulfosarcina ovata subsp. sediminis TaxID=885957 RepID=A0A5K7ZJJ0_9BACT|nr:hypothetical protein DSCO28_28780 [Desulfosarcina ovata subsp. sediminis]